MPSTPPSTATRSSGPMMLDPDPLVQDFVGSAFPDDTLGELVSGPRWRLKPNKFGQDLPGLEIPLVECSPPPFQSDNIKYVVGTPVTTVINLLDWDESEGPSPLATSKGWVDVTANEFVTVAGETNGIPYHHQWPADDQRLRPRGLRQG